MVFAMGRTVGCISMLGRVVLAILHMVSIVVVATKGWRRR